MTEAVFSAIILGIVGGASGWAGYAIKYQRKYHLIAGWDPKQFPHPDPLATWIGNGSIAIGVICGAAIVTLIAAPARAHVIVTIAGIANGLAALTIAAGGIGRARSPGEDTR